MANNFRGYFFCRTLYVYMFALCSCRRWVQASRWEDLRSKSVDYLHANCKLCADHFEDNQFMNAVTRSKLICANHLHSTESAKTAGLYLKATTEMLNFATSFVFRPKWIFLSLLGRQCTSDIGVLLLSFLPLPPFPLPSPFNPARESGERCKLPQQVWAEPGHQTHFGAFWTWKTQGLLCSLRKMVTKSVFSSSFKYLCKTAVDWVNRIIRNRDEVRVRWWSVILLEWCGITLDEGHYYMYFLLR